MVILKRKIKKIVKKSLFKQKIVIIYGARQVGKTTLVKEIIKEFSEKKSIYLNCDEPDIRQSLTNRTSTELKDLIGENKIVVIDEAQRVKDIGVTLKLISDNFSDMQVIATGSSSFELSNKISEPLTGRKFEFLLLPISLEELKNIETDLETNRLLEKRMIYGMYPEILFNSDDRFMRLKTLANSYLFKDVLQYQNIRNPEILEKLLQALALQIGNEVSYNELANTLGIDKNTVSSYMQILEKAFIVFRIKPYFKNKRNELSKLRKIYFYDIGIRNALINNFNPLELRQDTGAIWENFVISERMKHNNNNNLNRRLYFWRTVQKQEVDLIEEEGDSIRGFEIKWRKEKLLIPKSFKDMYPGVKVDLLNNDNYLKLSSS